jgi:hypothetical protein
VKRFGEELPKWTGVDGIFEVHHIPGRNIAAEVGVLGDIKR